jgi:hypothetical protein
VKFDCPHCNQRLEVEDEDVGMKFECPTCRNILLACAPAEPAEPPDPTPGAPPPLPPAAQPPLHEQTAPGASGVLHGLPPAAIVVCEETSHTNLRLSWQDDALVAESLGPSGESRTTRRFPKPQLGAKGGYALGMGKLVLDDDSGKRQTFVIGKDHGDRVFKWLQYSCDIRDQIEERHPEAARRIAEVADAVDAYYPAQEFNPDTEDCLVFLALTQTGISVFRNPDRSHPLFDGDSTFFAFGEYSFVKGAGNMAASLGLALGGMGGQEFCRIVDDAGACFCFSATKPFVQELLGRAGPPTPGACSASAEQRAAPVELEDLPTGGSLPEAVCAILSRHGKEDDLHVKPDIPAKKVRNATRSCKVPSNETIIGLIDCTVFGSAKNALVFTEHAVYLHNDWAGKTSGQAHVPYDSFGTQDFEVAEQHEVHIGAGKYLNTSGTSVGNGRIVAILDAIKYVVAPETRPAPSAATPTTPRSAPRKGKQTADASKPSPAPAAGCPVVAAASGLVPRQTFHLAGAGYWNNVGTAAGTLVAKAVFGTLLGPLGDLAGTEHRAGIIALTDRELFVIDICMVVGEEFTLEKLLSEAQAPTLKRAPLSALTAELTQGKGGPVLKIAGQFSYKITFPSSCGSDNPGRARQLARAIARA